MGAFLLSVGRSAPPVALDVLAEQGFHEPRAVRTDAFELTVFGRQQEPKASFVDFGGGDFAASVGTLLLDGRLDADALPLVRRRFRGDFAFLDEAVGSFAVLLHLDGELHLATDGGSMFPVYLAPEHGLISTSFMALASALPAVTLGTQAVHEFVLNGDVLGDETLVREVSRFPWRSSYHLRDGRLRRASLGAELPEPDGRPRAVLLEETAARLTAYVEHLSKGFEDRICSALTAGYDSRLLLAMLRSRDVLPRLIVYREDEMNVPIVRAVAAADGVDLEVIDRSDAPVPSVELVLSVVRRNLLAADGYFHDGVFIPDQETSAREDRSPRGWVFLHGGGGEVYRNFLQLPGGRYTARDVAKTLYTKWDSRACGPSFDLQRYLDAIAAKIEQLTGTAGGKLERQWIEWLYPAFRGRSWTGRENGLNSWIGASLTPFFERSIAAPAARIPLRYKAAGTFEADLIARLRPSLAAITSQYGHAFAGPPPRTWRLREGAKAAVPPAVRPALQTLLKRPRRRSEPDGWMAPSVVGAVLPDGAPRVGPLFRTDKRVQPEILARVLSVEVLLRELPAARTEWGG